MYEYLGEQTDRSNIGIIDFNTEHDAPKRPLWSVLLKLFGLLAMLPIGYVLVIPLVPLPAWQSIAAASGVLLIYIGVAFFVHPNPDTDNLGWAGGLVDDPFRYGDDVNRWLLFLHCALGPGRFASETILDACALLGVTKPAEPQSTTDDVDREVAIGGTPIAPLAADRFESHDDYHF